MKKVIKQCLPNQKEAARRPLTERLFDNRPVPKVLSSFAKGKKFYIRTYGCQGNIRDEEIMAGYLAKAGFTRTDNPEECNLAIINTCAVRENAEEKIYGEIGSYKAHAMRDKDFILVIAGCVMGEDEVGEKLLKTYPYISLIFGTHDVSNINELLATCIAKKSAVINVRSFASEVVENMPSLRLNSYQAYVNISYGCDKFCTYCIVPFTRGRERSRKLEDVVKECQELVSSGYKQITLLGQNVNSYGLDLNDGTSFAKLLEEVAKTGIPRLRFLTSYPSQFTEEMIGVMQKYSNIDRWLHFPAQSGSSSCLKRMGRRYSREEYLALVDKLYKAMPDLSITTDIIVGFPGESEEEFLDTLSLCKEARYSSAFTFIFSPRQGTPAAKMKQVDEKVTHERFNRLKILVDELTAIHSNAMVGKIYDVLVEGPSKKDPTFLSGYATNGKLVHFKGPSSLEGCIVPVKINVSHTYSLIGELVIDPIIAKAKDVAYLMSLDPVLKAFKSLDKEVRSSREIGELEESLIKKKKAFALSINHPNEYQNAKEDYLKALALIEKHPLLLNRDALQKAAASELYLIKEMLS